MIREITGVGAVIAWFVYLTHRALSYGFNPDDEMLINYAIARPLKLNLESVPFFWNGYIRPLGSIFYLGIYRVFGYWSPPYRTGAFVLLALNIVLLYRFAKTLTNSIAASLLVILIGCFHREMWEMYANTGTIYDILCQTFILLALTVWVKAKDQPAWRTIALVASLTICAVDSKELGVAIPPLLLVYDLLFRRKAIRYGAIAASGCVVAVFLLGRFAQPTLVTGNPMFTPVITLAHYLGTTQFYLNLLLFKPGLNQLAAVALLPAAGLLALLMRNRLMLFGWAYYIITLLPMCFAPARSGYALYIPQTGALLFLVGLVVALLGRRPALIGVLATFVMAGQFTANRTLEAAHVKPGYLQELEAFTNGIRRAYPHPEKGTHFTLVNDPLIDLYVPKYTLQALYNDPTISIEKVRWNPALGPEQLHGGRDVLFFSGLRCWRFGSRDEGGEIVDGRPRETVSMASPLAAWNIVSGVDGEPRPDGRRWAFADPEFVFTRPSHASQLRLDYEIPGAVMEQTGPLRLTFTVDGKTPEQLVVSKPATLTYSTPVAAKGDPLVHFKIHVANPYLGSDGTTKLSFFVSWAGLQ